MAVHFALKAAPPLWLQRPDQMGRQSVKGLNLFGLFWSSSELQKMARQTQYADKMLLAEKSYGFSLDLWCEGNP